MLRRSGPWLLSVALFGCEAPPVVPELPTVPWEGQADAIERLEPVQAFYSIATDEELEPELSAWYAGRSEPVRVRSGARWFVADEDLATVTGDGSIVGVSEGTTSIYALLGGVQSAPAALAVGRGSYQLAVEQGAIARRGKLVDLVLSAEGVDFETAEVELSIEGLLPFGEERTTDPWWGPDPTDSSRYRARFLVPPAASLGHHDLEFTLDGAAPAQQVRIEVQGNASLEIPRGCGYFADDPASDWTFENDGTGSEARTWLIGELRAQTVTHWAARSVSSGDVDPWLALWSLDGDLLEVQDGFPGASDDEAGVDLTSLADVFDGAFYLTASISPNAGIGQTSGSIATDCLVENLPSPMLEARTGFPNQGLAISPGTNRVQFDLDGPAGTVARAYVYLDLDLARPDRTVVTLRSPTGTEVVLMDEASNALLSSDTFVGTLGAPLPFRPVADALAGTGDTTDFAGEPAAGTWELEVEVSSVGELGAWRDARMWVATD